VNTGRRCSTEPSARSQDFGFLKAEAKYTWPKKSEKHFTVFGWTFGPSNSSYPAPFGLVASKIEHMRLNMPLDNLK